MRDLYWDKKAWEDYIYWQSQDKKTLKRINKLIQNILVTPFTGIGKPEPLKENLSGARIGDSHLRRRRRSARMRCVKKN